MWNSSGVVWEVLRNELFWIKKKLSSYNLREYEIVFYEMYILDVYYPAVVYMKIKWNKAYHVCYIQEFGYV